MVDAAVTRWEAYTGGAATKDEKREMMADNP